MSDMEERVKQVMADILDLDPVSIEDGTAMDTVESWDSLSHVHLCTSLEQDFQVSFSVSEIESMLSYEDILRVLGAKLG